MNLQEIIIVSSIVLAVVTQCVRLVYILINPRRNKFTGVTSTMIMILSLVYISYLFYTSSDGFYHWIVVVVAILLLAYLLWDVWQERDTYRVDQVLIKSQKLLDEHLGSKSKNKD